MGRCHIWDSSESWLRERKFTTFVYFGDSGLTTLLWVVLVLCLSILSRTLGMCCCA